MASTPDVSQRPVTPPPDRGRARTRYPSHLSREVDAEGKPRPLLHRRGTSRTYETLEDLLKEAGYKETRIFTPEVDRREAEREERRQREAKQDAEGGGVGGAVVKLFSMWTSRRGPAVDHGEDDNVRIPSSPLAHRTRHNASSLRLPASSSSSLTVRPLSDSRTHPRQNTAARQSSLSRQHTLTRPSLTASSTSTVPTSRARIALRHAASAPHIDKRRRTPRAARAPKPKVPPLPPTWLASISAALLSPRLPPSPSPSPVRQPRKPAILTQSAHTSLGPVTTTTVLCRSAPASRAASPHRLLVPAEELAAAWPPHSPHHLPVPALQVVDDDDDADEPNLAMMLIPAKRQHSIRSLRSVLLQHTHPAPDDAAREEYARMMRRRIEEGDGDGHWDSGEFLIARVKRKRNRLPKHWGWSS